MSSNSFNHSTSSQLPGMGLFKPYWFLLFLLVFWLLSGMYLGMLVHGIIILSVLFLAQKRRYLELFLGFFFILILSDSRNEALEFAKQAKEFYIVLLALFVLFDYKFRPYKLLVKYFIPFFMVASVALFFSETLVVSFLKMLSYFLILFITPNFINRLYEEHGDMIFKHLIYFCAAILAYGVILWFVNPDSVMLAGRYSGLFGNPNGLGVFLLLLFMLFELLVYYRPELFSKKERYIILGLAIISLLLTGSRTALVGTVIFYSFKYTQKISYLLSFTVVLLVVLLYQPLMDLIPDIIRYLNLEEYARLNTLKDASGRLIAYEFAWEHIQKNYWLGKGFAYSEHLFQEYYRILSRMGHEGGSHNSYLAIWLDTGLIGLIFFVAGWAMLFLKAARYSLLALPIALALVFSTFLEAWLTASLNPFTIMVLIILAITMHPSFTEVSYAEN